MRFGEFRRNVYDRLGEDFDSPARYLPVLVHELVREACEQWVVANGGNLRTYTFSLAASTLEYHLPTDVVQVMEVIENANSIPLVAMTWAEMGQNYEIGSRAWRDITDVRPFHYLLRGCDRIWIWPMLTAPTASNTITVTYTSSVIDDLDAALSDDNEDITTVPREFHDVMVDYVVGRCMMIGASDETHLADATGLVQNWVGALGLGGFFKQQAGPKAPSQGPILNR